MSENGCAAAPREELESQVMDSNIPKNEREWWARGQIETLRARIAELEAAQGSVDHFIPLADVQREAEKCRIMLDKGEGDTDPLYAAYNTMLMVLGYGTMPPSEMHAAAPSTPSREADLHQVRCAFADWWLLDCRYGMSNTEALGTFTRRLRGRDKHLDAALHAALGQEKA